MAENSSILEGLFDSDIKVKLLKLFLQNEEEKFTLDDITERTQSDSSSVRYQLRKLRDISLISSALVRFPSEQEEKEKGRKRRVYFANPNFSLLPEIKELILKPVPIDQNELEKELKSVGKIKLAALSGIFKNLDNIKTDLLLIGEDIEKEKLEAKLKKIEAEMGKKVRYTSMDTDEFNYRIDMFDNFLKKIFKNPHDILIKKIEVPF